MLGIDDPQIWLAYVACVASTLLCVVYGALNWRESDEEKHAQKSGTPKTVVQEQ